MNFQFLTFQIPQFVCTFCSKMYSRKRSLRAHMIGVHAQGKQRKCNCGRTFPYEANYYQHRKKCSHALGSSTLAKP